MQITKQTLRSLHVDTAIYRWFLHRFPYGAGYAEVHAELVKSGRIEWANSLLKYAYLFWSEKPLFWHEEARVTQGVIDSLIHHLSMKTDFLENRAGETAFILNRQSAVQLSCVTDFTKVVSEGYCSKVINTGVNNIIASTGIHSWISNIADCSHIAGSGDVMQISNTGQNSRIGSAGIRSKISNVGNSVKMSSSGEGTRVANAGMRSCISSHGRRAKIVNSGDLCQINSLAADALIANVGNDAKITALGENTVVMSAGSICYVILGKGGCASIPYYDGNRIRFATAYEGEHGIQAGVKYCLNEHNQFVEYHDE